MIALSLMSFTAAPPLLVVFTGDRITVWRGTDGC
jgi:hypothetical protein